jgi:hypothetical protein
MRHTGGLQRRASVVVQSEANVLEARLWIVSGLPTMRELSGTLYTSPLIVSLGG